MVRVAHEMVELYNYELGALAKVHSELRSGGVQVYATSGVTDGRGGYGYILWVKPEDINRASELLDW